MTHKIGAEIAQGEAAFREPVLRFFRGDQVVLITKLFRGGVDRRILELEILFIGLFLGRDEPQEILPGRLQFTAKMGRVDHVAHVKGPFAAGKNDLAVDRWCLSFRHRDLFC